jgi:hypothetical protein
MLRSIVPSSTWVPLYLRDDKELWTIVAFLRKLPTVTPEDFKSWTAAHAGGAEARVCTENLDPDVLVMEASEDGRRYNGTHVLDGTMDRSILVEFGSLT